MNLPGKTQQDRSRYNSMAALTSAGTTVLSSLDELPDDDTLLNRTGSWNAVDLSMTPYSGNGAAIVDLF